LPVYSPSFRYRRASRPRSSSPSNFLSARGIFFPFSHWCGFRSGHAPSAPPSASLLVRLLRCLELYIYCALPPHQHAFVLRTFTLAPATKPATSCRPATLNEDRRLQDQPPRSWTASHRCLPEEPVVAQHSRPHSRIWESFWLSNATWYSTRTRPLGRPSVRAFVLQCIQPFSGLELSTFQRTPGLHLGRSSHRGSPPTSHLIVYHRTLRLHLDQNGRNPEHLHSTHSWLSPKPEPRGLYLGPSINHHRATATPVT
jgi:hypothetical protein